VGSQRGAFSKYESNLGVDPAYTKGDFYDVPPYLREKRKP
jgi:hypothetical protein